MAAVHFPCWLYGVVVLTGLTVWGAGCPPGDAVDDPVVAGEWALESGRPLRGRLAQSCGPGPTSGCLGGEPAQLAEMADWVAAETTTPCPPPATPDPLSPVRNPAKEPNSRARDFSPGGAKTAPQIPTRTPTINSSTPINPGEFAARKPLQA